MHSVVFQLTVLITYAGCLPDLKHAKLSTKYGEVIGLMEKSRGGREYYSFRGIPFAKPPVGDLRFKVTKILFK